MIKGTTMLFYWREMDAGRNGFLRGAGGRLLSNDSERLDILIDKNRLG
jgi:hypothetical protein